MPSTEFLRVVSTELLRVVKISVLGIFELLNFWQNLSTVAYKPVAYKKIIVYIFYFIISHGAIVYLIK